MAGLLGLAQAFAPILGALGGVPSRPIDGGASLRQSERSAELLAPRHYKDIPVPQSLEPSVVDVPKPLEVLPSEAPKLEVVEEKLHDQLREHELPPSPPQPLPGLEWMVDFHVDREGEVK